jgi:hypothetical protein
MNIIESIGAWGVRTTSRTLYRVRCERPQSGDVIDFGEYEGIYPYTSGRYGRIVSGPRDASGMWPDEMVGFCCQPGSAFLLEDGSVDVSGGPFGHCSPSELEPTHTTRRGLFWNWGGNTRGAGQGVEYLIDRPVFRLRLRCQHEECNVPATCQDASRRWSCGNHSTDSDENQARVALGVASRQGVTDA